MSNPLTRDAGLRLGPVVLDTLLRHYLHKLSSSSSSSSAGPDAADVPLRRAELLYDEVFHIVRSFLLQASEHHTVEELQAFSNTRTPSPPAALVVRVTVPRACCDDAAVHLIEAFGGEEQAKKVVGGVKWWQVRGVSGVSAEWLCAKKDIDDARRAARARRAPTLGTTTAGAGGGSRFGTLFERRARMHARGVSEPPPPPRTDAGVDEENKEGKDEVGDGDAYAREMDGMKCVLFLHGGGYYFGSVDQERHAAQRLARKLRARALALNYRLAPQYPFPCAVQDALAAYLFLIRPPPGAAHAPVAPRDIVVAGDSAGGGLSLALLQVLRDAGLPLPAGGVLISPWCDLTHSFPSIFQNTLTDVIPATGLSMHKPSALWPPPPDAATARMREGLRATVRRAFRRSVGRHEAGTPGAGASAAADGLTTPGVDEHGTVAPGEPTTPAPAPPHHWQSIALETQEGTTIEPGAQLQLYAPNALVTHPLVSPALGYLGGLPPLLVIASEREVLRDEIVYTAHRAAHPERFAIRADVRALYAPLRELDADPARMVPTAVHLQVYDDAAHVLPILFPFTQPAKYCFRAMAAFCRQVFEHAPVADSAGRADAKHAEHDLANPKHAAAAAESDPVATIVVEKPLVESPAAEIEEFIGAPKEVKEGEKTDEPLEDGMAAARAAPETSAPVERGDVDKATTEPPNGHLPLPIGEAASSEVEPTKPSLTGLAADSEIASSTSSASPHAASAIGTVSVEEPRPHATGSAPQNGHLAPPRAGSSSSRHPSFDAPATNSKLPFPPRLARHKSHPTGESNSSSGDKGLRTRPSLKALSSVIARYGTLRRTGKAGKNVGGPSKAVNGAPPVTNEKNTGVPAGIGEATSLSKSGSEDVAGPRGKGSQPHAAQDVLAGDPVVYSGGWPRVPPTMIRERVATHGAVRALEPEAQLSAFALAPDKVGVVPVAAIRRHADAKARMERRHARTLERIAARRARAMAEADAGQLAHMSRLQHYLDRQGAAEGKGKGKEKEGEGKGMDGAGVFEGLLGPSWSLAWALDADEQPPPSSIVARHDTKEALALARVADQAIFAPESSLNANNLWTLMLNFFTATPERKEKEKAKEKAREERANAHGPSAPEHVVGREKAHRRRSSLGLWRAGRSLSMKVRRDARAETMVQNGASAGTSSANRDGATKAAS